MPTSPSPQPGYTTYEYVVSGTPEQVAAKAGQQLSSKDGWEWLAKSSMVYQSKSRTFLGFERVSRVNPDDPPLTAVKVSRPTTTFDPIKEWTFNHIVLGRNENRFVGGKD
ncbi:MAG TPA: hypothetical protein VNI20_06555 [Fimbriimonadaceae bacterium]|nr:hypothetical protein [Fimbriimonadaceae bacterium]